MDNVYYVGNRKIKDIKLFYYVCGDKSINDISGYFEWGIKIVKIEKTVEEITVRNISPDFNKISRIAEILMRNTVTPSGIYDALYNISENPVI